MPRAERKRLTGRVRGRVQLFSDCSREDGTGRETQNRGRWSRWAAAQPASAGASPLLFFKHSRPIQIKPEDPARSAADDQPVAAERRHVLTDAVGQGAIEHAPGLAAVDAEDHTVGGTDGHAATLHSVEADAPGVAAVSLMPGAACIFGNVHPVMMHAEQETARMG